MRTSICVTVYKACELLGNFEIGHSNEVIYLFIILISLETVCV